MISRLFATPLPQLILPLLLAALPLCVAGAATGINRERPNILVIVTDDQGWADIGYNNPTNVYTPNLDRLAATGARLASHYVMPQCTPTRVALMTGRLPGRFGGNATEASTEPAFPMGTFTMAGMLRSAGYETYLCGKWHLGSSPHHGPNQFGFDHSYGSLSGAVGMYDHRYRQGKYERTWHRDGAIISGSENGRHVTDLVSEDAIRFIKQQREKPFFLYLAFHAPHTPLDERGQFVDQPTALDPRNPTRWRNEERIRWFNDPEGKIQRQTDPQKRLLLAAVHHLDHAIGEVIRTLDETGQRTNTIIFFSSDNGPQMAWAGNAYPHDLPLRNFNQPLPLRGVKCDVWEGGIHVPGFVNWPGRIQPKTVAEAVHIVDWLPTLAALTGASAPAGLDGVDLSPVLFGDGPLPERALYWLWGGQPNRWALRAGDWKTVHYGPIAPKRASDWQLFNLEADPVEANNVATDHPDVVRRLHELFLKQHAKDQPPP
jgi:arylsulfatase A-like enzyme